MNKLRRILYPSVAVLLSIVLIIGLYISSVYNFLLFHTIAELFSIIIAFCVFIISFYARKFSRVGFFTFYGISFLYIGIIDFLHTLAYKGMDIFIGYNSNLPTQLWILARYFQSVTIFISFFLINRKIKIKLAFLIFSVASAVFIPLIFMGIFPDCFIESVGLTPFKVYSEYIIIAITGVSILLFYSKRNMFNKRAFSYLIGSFIFLIVSELFFTFYIDVYGISNLMGHFFKIFSFYCIFRALVVMTLYRPYDTLFKDLKQIEQKLLQERNELLGINKKV